MSPRPQDMALVYQLLAEPPRPDHYYYRMYGVGTGPPKPHLHGFGLTQDLKGLKLGIFPEHFNDGEPAVVEACRAALVALVARGAKTHEVHIPHMHALSVSHGMVIQAEFALMHDGYYSSPKDFSRLEAFTRMNLALAMEFKAVEVYAANTLRGYAFDLITKMFQSIDVLVMPTVGQTAPELAASARPHGESDNAQVMQVIKHIFLGNYLGIPCMTAPVGYHAGLPIGFQACAGHWMDHHTLRVANAIEQAVLTRQRPPPENFFDVLGKQSRI